MEFRNAEVIKANLPEWFPFIEQHYGVFTDEVKSKLLTISAATMKRYFKRARELGGKGLAITRPGSILRTEIPILTASLWDATVPGKMAADTVAHCGTSSVPGGRILVGTIRGRSSISSLLVAKRERVRWRVGLRPTVKIEQPR